MALELIEVGIGEYTVGDDSVVNASPRHRRLVDAPFWIDPRPLSVAHFEAFVVGGGYRSESLWAAPVDGSFADARWSSVDARCREIYDASTPSPTLGRSPDRPVTGLTWFEAAAVARFFGARLPYEVEWEVAMTGQAGPARKGAVVPGLLEWTADAYAPKYWRADFPHRGVDWPAPIRGTAVCVRGSGPNALVRHLSQRSGRDPSLGDKHCGFRRVWDYPPAETDVGPARQHLTPSA